MPIGRMQLPRELRSNGGIMSMQGGMKNYLGEQPMVNAPKYWQSRPDKPQTELAYITEDEKNLIMDADIHGSLRPNVRGFDGPNEGPSGIMSLDYQGDKGTYGQAGQSYGDRERPGQSSVDTGRTHHATDTTMKTSTKTVSPKDHFEQSWSGPKGLFSGGYRNLNVPGQTKHGHKSRFNPLGMLLGLINPALGLAYRGFTGLQNLGTKYGTKMGDWRENLTGYRTQADWEKARQNRINEKRMSYLSDRKSKGLGYGKQAYEDLLSQGYSDSFQDAINKDLEINPEQTQFAKSYLQSVAKDLPENIKALDEYTTGSIDFNPGMTVGYGTGIEKIDPSVTQSYTSANDLPEEFQDLATHAKVTKQDLARYTPRTQKNLIDAQTYRSALDSGTINPNMTEFEFNKMREGLITQPGTYTEEDFA